MRKLSARVALAIDNVVATVGYVRPVVLVTGFWRSGTTWMQECLAEALRAKTSFEPLTPSLLRRDRVLAPFGLTSPDHEHAFVPFLDGSDPRYAAMWKYLEEAVRGHCAGTFGLVCRKGVLESLRRDLVLKCVRMQFSQRAFHRRFGLPIVHVRRHPCAVVASLRDCRWPWHFRNVDITALLYEIGDGREERLSRWRTVIPRFGQDVVSRIAAYWALSESYVQHSLAELTPSLLVNYEQAVTSPVRTLHEICARLALPPPGKFDPSADSALTGRASAGQSNEYRLTSWRTRLSPSEIERVYSVVAEIFPEWDDRAHAAA